MWSPANPQALPSQEERRLANKAITQVESQLIMALEALAHAQSVVDNLRTDLLSRRAWLAPIRRVPPEILSEIFVLVTEIEAYAPIKISEVSRRWRKIVLGTPRAWSMIFTRNRHRSFHKYASTFLERSKPCPLHLYMPDDDPNISPLIKAVFTSSLYRMECLSVSTLQLVDFDGPVFPSSPSSH